MATKTTTAAISPRRSHRFTTPSSVGWHTRSVTTTRPGTSIATSVLVLAAMAAVVDWLVKVLATVTLDDRSVEAGSLVTLRASRRAGVAIGVGHSLPGTVVVAVTAMVTLVLAVAAVRSALSPWWAARLVSRGAFANVAARALGGQLVNFIDLGWWPSFNQAE